MKKKSINRYIGVVAMCGILLWGCEEEAANNAPPEKGQASASVSETLLVNGQSAEFIDESGQTVKRIWNFEGGNPKQSTDPNVEVMYENAGEYKASLTLEYESGLSELVVFPIKVLPDLEPRIGLDLLESDSGFHISIGDEVKFLDQSIGEPDQWEWIFEGATPLSSTEQNPSITYNTLGDYDVTLKTTRNNPDGSTEMVVMSELIHVNSIIPVVANFEVDKKILAPGESIAFTSKSLGSPDVFEWQFEGGVPTTSTSKNPSVKYNNSGWYNVYLKTYKASRPENYDEIDTLVVYVRAEDQLCTASPNLLACGNFDLESEDISEWVAGTSGSVIDRMPKLSYSPTLGKDGSGAIIFEFDGNGAPVVQFYSQQFEVKAQGDYTFSADLYAETLPATGGNPMVVEVSLISNHSGNTELYKSWQAPAGMKDQWYRANVIKTLPPGKYNIAFKVYNGAARWRFDNVAVVRN
ncbi:PKD domain-containing protein [Reichenbachiella agarivorans]|uniref:PKD domain-containing protein n=1 Tax=Reichenbachiella agarivorans TaxID=2979464 RepID=A0ABY6CNG2_9BACT|nr:PKD domain-containing protein [Reichenbachiella agarivorans]UXP32058.1 PKD domain-containing protein [Reichenbachiella agarivorans]